MHIKKLFLSLVMIGFAAFCFIPNVSADTSTQPPKENSWRYSNGVSIESENSDLSNFNLPAKLTTAIASTTPVSKYTGIDVSHHNGNINWASVKAAGIDYAIIRCGYGNNDSSQDDTKWLYNVKQCVANKIPFGVYIYSYATNTTEAVSEANHVLRCLTAAGLTSSSLSLPIYLDMEDNTTLVKGNSSSIQDNLASIATTFCNTMISNGYTNLGVYGSYSWFNNYLTNSCFDGWSRWVARYNSYCGYTKPYDMWQYSSTGKVNGISGNVDMNYWYGADISLGGTTIDSSNLSSATVTVGKVKSLTASGKTSSTLSMKWSSVKNATGYQVFRSTSPNGTYKFLKSVGSSTTTLTNYALKTNREYYYKVRAYITSEGKTYYGAFTPMMKNYTSIPYNRSGKTKTSSYIRGNAGTSYSKIAALTKNSSVKIYCVTYDKYGSKWYRIRAKQNGKYYYGYIKASLIKSTSTAKTKVAVTMRKSTSTSSKKVVRIAKGQTVTIKKILTVSKKSWYNITYTKKGKTYTGYIKASKTSN